MITVVVDYDPETERRITIHAFLETELREADTCVKELKRAHPTREIVVIQAANWEELRRSNPKFFPVWDH